MPKLTHLSNVIQDAAKNLATLFTSKRQRRHVQLSLECLEDKLLLTGMALLPHRPLLNNGGLLTEHAFTPSAYGFGVFNPGNSFSISNEASFTYFEYGNISTDITYSYGSIVISSILSDYSLEIIGNYAGGTITFTGLLHYTYDFSFDPGPGPILHSGRKDLYFTESTIYGYDNTLYISIVSSVLNDFTSSSYPLSLIDITSTSTGTFSYEYTAEGVSSVTGTGSSQVPFLPLGYTGVDTYQYSGVTTYAIEKTGNGTLAADNWFMIDGDASCSTLPDYTLALVCYSYEKDASLSMTSSATSVFSANGTSSLIFSTQETFSANGSQAGGSYSYSNNYQSSGRETYSYSALQTQTYIEHVQGSLSEDSAGTFSYSGSTPSHTRLTDSLIEAAAGTYSLNKYTHREMTGGTGQRLSTYTIDANGTTSSGHQTTNGTADAEIVRTDGYSFSGSSNSTVSYSGAVSSTWNRPASFTQVETYSYLFTAP